MVDENHSRDNQQMSSCEEGSSDDVVSRIERKVIRIAEILEKRS